MKYIKYHKDGSIWAKGQMINNQMEGFWEFFRKDGTIMRSGYFLKGKQIKEWKTFDRKGNLMKTTDFKTGKNESVDEYINGFESNVKEKLNSLRKLILDTNVNLVETIKYGMPTYVYKGKNFVHFAGYKHHIGFYPTPKPIEKFVKDLKGFKYSKGAIQFPNDKPLPLNLINKLIKVRLKEFNQ